MFVSSFSMTVIGSVCCLRTAFSGVFDELFEQFLDFCNVVAVIVLILVG